MNKYDYRFEMVRKIADFKLPYPWILCWNDCKNSFIVQESLLYYYIVLSTPLQVFNGY